MFQVGQLTLLWVDADPYTVFTFTLATSTDASNQTTQIDDLNNYYIALGFSTDQKMGGDDVVSCMMLNGQGTVTRMYNSGRQAPQLFDSSDPSLGIMNASISNANGIFTCSFIRQKSNGNYSNYYNLSNPFYLLVAQGNMASGLRTADLQANSPSKLIHLNLVCSKFKP
jgi:hypothetical protein